jgi:hypothetical protein
MGGVSWRSIWVDCGRLRGVYKPIVFILETAYFAHKIYPQFQFTEGGVDEPEDKVDESD